MNILSKLSGYAGVVGFSSLPMLAFAAGSGVDVSAATGALSDAATAIGAIGVVMIAAASAGIVYRWVTAFLIK